MDGIRNNNQFIQNKQTFRAASYAPQYPAVQVPDLYYQPEDTFEPQGVKETIKKMDPMEMIYPWFENPLLMAGTTGGLIWGLGKFGDSFGGEYEKSIVGRAARLGDKIQKSSVIDNKAVHTTVDTIKKGSSAFKKFICKNDAIRAMFETPGMPEWDMPKHEMVPSERRLVESFNRVVSEFGLTSEATATGGIMGMSGGRSKGLSLENLGLDKAEKEFLKKEYNIKNVFKISNTEEAVNKILIRRFDLNVGYLGKENCSELIKNDIIEKVLNTNKEELAKLVKDETKESAQRIYEILEKCKYRKNLRVSGGHYKLLGKAQVLERTIGVESVFNNLKAVLTNTGLSKCFAKITQGFYNCLTFFGGGKLCVLAFIAPMFARAISNTKKADKGEKVGTLTDGIITGTSWVLTFPLGMKLMHAIGGMQFAGMSKDQVEEFRKRMVEIETKNKAGSFATKKEYNDAWKELKDFRKSCAKDQSIITKMLKKVGSFLEIGNENKKGWIKKDGNKIANWFRRSGNRMKNIVGVPLRFCLFMFGIQALLDKVISKAAGKVFGNHYDAMAAEETEARKKEQEKFAKQDLQKRLLEMQAQKQGVNVDGSPIQAQNIETVNPNEAGSVQNEQAEKAENQVNPQTQENNINTNNVAETVNNTPAANNQTIVTNPAQESKIDNYTYIPSSENVLNNAQNNVKQKAKYIPSQVGANLNKTFDNSGLDAVLRRANKAEQQALDVLAGRFPNM